MPPEKPKLPSIECAKNGPYLLRNVDTFTNSRGDAIPTRRSIALCRCGASKNKPFCDGRHWYIDFKDDEARTRGDASPTDLTHVLLNNSQLGKISKEQRAGDWEVWQTSLHNPDFAEYAKLCGGHGSRVTKPGELDDALAAAMAYTGPALVEVVSDPELI